MKKQHYKNLRYCEKIKENQCFIEADGLQKKIRKFNANKVEGHIDAQMKMREIECFWKEGWEYNHTHHIYLQPKITRPQFFLKNSRQSNINPKLEHYYDLLDKYITKLKIENQDETNFKIEEIMYNPSKDQFHQEQKKSQMEIQLSQLIEFQQNIQEKQIANLSFIHLIQIVENISNQMISNFEKSILVSQDNMMDEAIDEEQIRSIKEFSEICQMILQKNERFDEIRQDSIEFMQLIMEIINQSKESKIYSSVISLQPFLGQITSILHPLVLGLYSTFSKELLVKDAKKKRGKRFADEEDEKLKLNGSLLKQQFRTLKLLKIQDNFKLEEEKHSKILFLNLDGYESEFNLEFIRNFSDNIMYASFPKFSKNNESKHYNHRFYKKIMYNFTRPQIDILGFSEQLQGMNLTIQREELLFNPEKYHDIIDQIYHQSENNNKPSDFNKNFYVFPINLDNIQSEHDISREDNRIEGYESHFIRFVLRDHLYSCMKSFKPNSILISYSGKIQIENDHFVEMMQELVKICPKIIFFPNYTSALIDPNSSINAQTNYGVKKIGRGIITQDDSNDLEIKMNNFYSNKEYNPWQVSLMDKLSIFLKVTAGFYNLIRPFEEQDLYSKYKSSRVFRYIIYLYNGLKNEYEHCKRRVQSSTLETARASLENTIKSYAKQINRCIPEYYKTMFNSISELLRGNINGQEYNLIVEDIRDHYPPSFEEDEPFILQWQQLRKAQELLLASAKYHEITQIQIRQKSSKQEYLSLKDERMNNLESLYRISFYYKDQSNQIVKLYKEATLLYKENQNIFNKNYFYIALTNLFTSNQQDIQHYIAKPKLNNRKLQRCQIVPVSFYDRNGIINRNNIYKVWTEWNYAETAHHVILYWPTDFDFISYYLHKMLKRKYQPQVLQRVFAANKSSQSLNKNDCTFFEINFGDNVDADIAPRWGCSALNIDDQIYIFGGSYGGEKSYLNFQNDISTIDLTDNNLHDFQPTKLRNLRKQLYCDESFWGKLRQKKSVNTFVRPRLQFQFYDRQDLLLDDNNEGMNKEEDYRKIYMIGGYGEQFKTPYSLFVNYYYEILIERPTRRLVSIKKRHVPDKVIPINIKAMIKNRGIYQKANILEINEGKDNEEQKCKEGMTNNHHYFHHRVVYALKNDQLNFKIKNLFAIELYQNSKKDFYNFARRIGEVKNTQEAESVLIRKIQHNKHQVLVEIGDIYYLYSLYLELNGEQLEEIPLMNESIISLDTKRLTIYALISHSKHTQSKCVLASETVLLPSQSIIEKEKHYALMLKELVTFQQSLNLHTLIICNVNEVALLHGVGFENCKSKEYLIKVKSHNKNELKRQQIKMMTVSSADFSTIVSFFAKKNNIISSIQFLQYSQLTHCFAIVRCSLNINRFSQGWKQTAQLQKICFVHNNIILQKMNFEARIDSFSDIESIILLIYTNKNVFYTKLNEITSEISSVEVAQLTDKKEIQRFKCMECLAKIVKNEQLYEDFSYFG